MINIDAVAHALEALSDGTTAKKRNKELSCLRGVRGVPMSELAKLGTTLFQKRPPIVRDIPALTEMFAGAFEDGLLAIGLLATLITDDPDECYDAAAEWMEMVDDTLTADAIGWLVIGPASLSAGVDVQTIVSTWRHHRRGAARRAVLAAGMAWTPTRIEGPSAAPLRAKMNTPVVRFVDAPFNARLAPLCTAFVRDTDPAVQKGLRRLLRAWKKSDKPAARAWADGVKGGLPKMLRKAL